MAWSISRDARLAELRQLHHARSATLANSVPGTFAHDGLTKECDAIYAEIKRLEASRGISPKAVLLALAVLALLVYSLSH
ncbi:hypothetical protein [Kitasatospora sp. NPDC017646]|uniref:hypothetical protein n=1 Tax=Kitasatospora sp. NPDC017646 TaxID=3364024 RepID=UPI00378FD41D